MHHKILRTFTSLLPVDKNRTGECNNCGACCRLPFRCIFLKSAEAGKEYCSIYKFRPPNCRKFPRSLEQYNLVESTCSFDFTKNTDNSVTPKKRDKEIDIKT